MEAYEGAVHVDEGHLASALALARLHLEQGAPEKGRAVCARLLQAHPNDLDAKLLVVQLLLAQVNFAAGNIHSCVPCKCMLIQLTCPVAGPAATVGTVMEWAAMRLCSRQHRTGA